MTYSTKDFYLAVLLLTNDFQLSSSERKNEHTVYFNFLNHDDEKLKNIINEFVNCEITANVKKFTKCISIIRNELNKHK